MLYTINLTLLQERYHGVQDVIRTPWPLTGITHSMTKIETQLQKYM